MSDDEIESLIDYLAENPTAGDLLRGTGGCRKFRYRRPGKGKSGGYRVVTFFTGDDLPVFLITVFSKGEKSNLSQSETNALGRMTKDIIEEYRSRK